MNAHSMPGPFHAVYSPSSAHRWTVCTASAQGIAALGEQPEGEEAAKGTAAHEELERVLKGGPLDAEHPAAYCVALAVDYVRQLPPGQMWIEQRVRLTDEIWGRCDVAHWHEETRTLTIVDLKNGYVGVDAEFNEQLSIYALGSIYTHKLPAKFVRLVVVQPNDFRPLPRVKQWVTTSEELRARAQPWAAIPDGPKTFVAGEQCTYCPLFGRCEASRDVLVRLGVALANSADAVPAAQVAIFSAMEKPIKDWFKALDKAQTTAALKGNVPPGMKLVTTSKHRAWKDEGAARAAILAKLGVDALDPPTPAQAKERGMSDAEVEAISIKPQGGPALAFASDKRAAWEPKTTAEMFGAVTAKG